MGLPMEKFIKTFKALSNETRLRILNILVLKECCVSEVMWVLDISESRASRQLAILKEAEFIKSRKEGSFLYYCLNDEPGGSFTLGIANMAMELSAKSDLLRRDRLILKKILESRMQ
jgi:ArsR family transcriptional regulator